MAAILLFAGCASAPCAAADAPAAPGGMYSTYATDDRQALEGLADTRPLTEAELLAALVSALDQLSKYPRATELPEIYRVPHERLKELVCTGDCAALATYQPGEGIFLDEKMKPETNLFDRSVLLHELVHYLQEVNGEHAGMRPCDRWYHRELEAYAVQKNFLIAVGSPIRVGYSAQAPTCADEVAR